MYGDAGTRGARVFLIACAVREKRVVRAPYDTVYLYGNGEINRIISQALNREEETPARFVYKKSACRGADA